MSMSTGAARGGCDLCGIAGTPDPDARAMLPGRSLLGSSLPDSIQAHVLIRAFESRLPRGIDNDRRPHHLFQ